MAPRIAKGKVHHRRQRIRVPGARVRRRASTRTTGQRAWRFYTVPGDPSKASRTTRCARPPQTWSGEWWKMGGGGTVWDGLAYDPRPISSTSAPATAGRGPRCCAARKGKDNLYVCSIIALRPDTGEMKWYYQVVPGDSWDYDSVQQLTLADLTINRPAAPRHHAGEQERLLLRARSDHGRVHLGAAVRAAQLGDRHRRRRPAGRSSVRDAFYGPRSQ